MKRIVAVVNPIAGKKRKISPEQMVQDVLSDNVLVDWLYWATAEMDIGNAVIEKLNSGVYDLVVVFGGDGTVNRIARALLHRNEPLLIIPLGSGNGLARHLKIPMNPYKALALALNGTTKSIDAAQMNNEIYFCTAGVGFDAYIAYKFAHAGSRGLKTYVKTVFREFFSYKSKYYTITSSNQQIKTKAFFITVANANQWGNNVKVAPHAKINDGLLELIVLKSFKWLELPMLLLMMVLNCFHRSYRIQHYSLPYFEINSNEKQLFAHFDGEPMLLYPPIVFKSLPGAIRVVVGNAK
ncbi:MAG TPA: YegS/Rv2252/BmrU family lipid kinase [Bacteroidales bacterium]|nr:YegS/Rv2252/BmrU family lipid kinase [Bacteroidales bacterium]